MCRQIGPFVEVGEEISNYGIKNRCFSSKFSIQLCHAFNYNLSTQRRNRARTRRGIKNLCVLPPFRWWLAAQRFRDAL